MRPLEGLIRHQGGWHLEERFALDGQWGMQVLGAVGDRGGGQ